MPGAKISPPLLSADFSRLEQEAARMVQAGADWLHIDVMDGHFVPNLTMGPTVIKSLRSCSDAYFDCHMLVTDPGRWVHDVAQSGAQLYTFHIEATPEPIELIRSIRKAGMKAGVAIKPRTSVDSVIDTIAQQADMILVMTVEPGFGGQKFMQDCLPKVKALRQKYPHLDIQVDGGLSPNTIDQAADAGANVIVAGSSIFGAEDPAKVIEEFRSKVNHVQETFIVHP